MSSVRYNIFTIIMHEVCTRKKPSWYDTRYQQLLPLNLYHKEDSTSLGHIPTQTWISEKALLR